MRRGDGMKPARDLKNSTGEVGRSRRRSESILLTFRGRIRIVGRIVGIRA
jgi:hypothetical protein